MTLWLHPARLVVTHAPDVEDVHEGYYPLQVPRDVKTTRVFRDGKANRESELDKDEGELDPERGA